MSVLQSFTLRSGGPEQSVDLGSGGGTVTVTGGTVFYRDEQGVTAGTADGSIADGGSATLVGTQFFSTTAARADGQVRLPGSSGLTQEIADRQAADAAHVAALDPHGDRKLAAILATFPSAPYPAALGYYSADSMAWKVRIGGLALNALLLTPLWSGPAGVTLNNWTVFVDDVAASVPTAVHRLGVWTIDDQANPLSYALGVRYATLLAGSHGTGDLGTLAVATANTSPVKATAVTIPANTWYGVSGVPQIALATIWIGNYETGMSGPMGSTDTPASVNAPIVALKQTGVTGALPATFVPNALSNVGHGIGCQRTA